MTANVALVHLPGNPLWKVCKTFGTDEFISFLFDFFSTLWLTYFLTTAAGLSFLSTVGLSTAALFALVGPVAEKPGFFLMHFYEAIEDYRTTPIEERKSFGFYIKKALSAGTKSVVEDICIHDPIYGFSMYFGLQYFTGTPPWIFCIICFFAAVFIVAFLEVGTKELLHRNAKRRLKKVDFEAEKYYEVRFCYSSEEKAKDVFSSLARKYVSPNHEPLLINYHDRYFTEKKWWNGRKMQLRSRERFGSDGKKLRSWQIVYSLASEEWKRDVDQYRYFVSLKEKMYLLASDDAPLDTKDGIVDVKAQGLVWKQAEVEPPINVRFERLVAQLPESMLISLDRIPERELFIIELKARTNRKDQLKEAMRYAMAKGGLQTTRGKLSLLKD